MIYAIILFRFAIMSRSIIRRKYGNLTKLKIKTVFTFRGSFCVHDCFNYPLMGKSLIYFGHGKK